MGTTFDVFFLWKPLVYWIYLATGVIPNSIQCLTRLSPVEIVGISEIPAYLRSRQNRRHFPDIFKCSPYENVWISIKTSLQFVLKGSIHDSAALVQIMDWRRPGDKPLAEPMMFSSLAPITRPQWVKPWNRIVPVNKNLTFNIGKHILSAVHNHLIYAPSWR